MRPSEKPSSEPSVEPSIEPSLIPTYSQAPVFLKSSSSSSTNSNSNIIIAIIGVIIGLLALVLFGTLYYVYTVYYIGRPKTGDGGDNDGTNAIPLQELLRTAGDTSTQNNLPLFQAISRASNVFKSGINRNSGMNELTTRNSAEIRVEDQYMTGIYNQGGDLSVEENPTKHARPTLSMRPESPSVVGKGDLFVSKYNYNISSDGRNDDGNIINGSGNSNSNNSLYRSSQAGRVSIPPFKL